MALIYCRYCGGKVSDKATECPHCGASLKEEVRQGTQLQQNSQIQPSGQTPAPQPTPESYYDEDNGSNAKWWILGITLLLAGGFYTFSRFLGKTDAVGSDTGTVLITDTATAEPMSEDTIVHITPEFTEAISKYEELGEFSECLAPVKRGGKWGFINVRGEEVIPCQYDEYTSFHEGKASVCKDNLWGYVNVKGEVVIPIEIRATFACAFSENRAFIVGSALPQSDIHDKEGVGIEDNYEWYFIDEKGINPMPGLHLQLPRRPDDTGGQQRKRTGDTKAEDQAEELLHLPLRLRRRCFP